MTNGLMNILMEILIIIFKANFYKKFDNLKIKILVYI